MRMKLVGNKLDIAAAVIKSGEASASIPRGTPICLTLSGTNDGLLAILPSGSAAKSHALAFGVALADVAAGAFGESQVFGFCSYAVLLRSTRAASSDSFSDVVSHPLACLLNIDTINNAFSTSGGTLAKTSYLPMAVLGESLASSAGIATASTDARTANTQAVKVFLRMM